MHNLINVLKNSSIVSLCFLTLASFSQPIQAVENSSEEKGIIEYLKKPDRWTIRISDYENAEILRGVTQQYNTKKLTFGLEYDLGGFFDTFTLDTFLSDVQDEDDYEIGANLGIKTKFFKNKYITPYIHILFGVAYVTKTFESESDVEGSPSHKYKENFGLGIGIGFEVPTNYGCSIDFLLERINHLSHGNKVFNDINDFSFDGDNHGNSGNNTRGYGIGIICKR